MTAKGEVIVQLDILRIAATNAVAVHSSYRY
jgi:hypothetical protein